MAVLCGARQTRAPATVPRGSRWPSLVVDEFGVEVVAGGGIRGGCAFVHVTAGLNDIARICICEEVIASQTACLVCSYSIGTVESGHGEQGYEGMC